MRHESKPPRAIPTRYAGVNFRSMLESRWAAFFDAMQWRWLYEPQELGGYIPDFVLTFERPILVEVKPEYSFEALGSHFSKIRKSGWLGRAMVVGVAPIRHGYNDNEMAIGSIECEESALGDDETVGRDVARLTECTECKRHSMVVLWGAWSCLLCGYYDGDHGFHVVEHGRVEDIWRRSSSCVQWGRQIHRSDPEPTKQLNEWSSRLTDRNRGGAP